MGRLIAKKDWSKHPLGPIEEWPEGLKTPLATCLHSSVPMAIYWGKDMHVLYNDAWCPLFGKQHPGAFGSPARSAWGEGWKIIRPALQKVQSRKKGVVAENIYLPVPRKGFTEECYFDYAFSPIFGDNQKVSGILNVGQNITKRLLAERRNRIHRRLYEKTFNAESPQAACIHISNVLSESPQDVPFALFYLINGSKTSLRLVASTLIDTDNPLAVANIDLEKGNQHLPFNIAVNTNEPQIIRTPSAKYNLPGGPWEESSRQVVMLPFSRPRSNETYGVLLLGISPRLVYDTFYSGFFKQLAEQTAFTVGSAYDLRRKLTLESRESETRKQLQAALSSNLVGVWTWDLPENRVYADQNLSYQLGIDNPHPEEGVPASAFLDPIHKEDKARVKKQIREAVSKINRFEAEYRLLSRDKQLRWVISRGKVEAGQNGKATRFSGITVDITDHKNTELELATTEHMFSALFQSSIIGVEVGSIDGHILEANQTFLKMFGYTKRDLAKGLHSDMITPPRSKSTASLIYRELRKKGELEPVEEEYMRKDGTIIPVLVGAVTIPDSPGRFIAFMLDISEQKQLLALNKAKDEFISIASHQLRTPATGVKQYLGMLIEGYAGEIKGSQKQILKTAYQSNERQLTIVNDLLRVAQADASEVKLTRHQTDLVPLIKDVVSEQQSKFAAKDQSVSFTTGRGKAYGMFDSFQLRMAFENIIDNAHKFSLEGRKIDVRLSATAKTVTVRIKDQGVGIRKKDLPRLFRKFSRIDNPLSMSAGGTGLGLYWVKKIIELHGGTIAATSQYGKGSEFVITLPAGVT